MYSYIKGTITEVCATHITLECNNIGYLIKVANPYQYELNSSNTIYIYQNVREDLIELFGFSSLDEKKIFISLISVKGLGPKGALAILATSSLNEILEAIDKGNSKYFHGFPGIGPKLSQQIILDLKGKINLSNIDNNKKSSSDKLQDVIIALKSLGYTQNEIKAVTKKLELTDDIPLKDAVKQALILIKNS